MFDDLGDRMKFYEGQETQRVFLPYLPIMVRIDGRSFSSFTKGLTRPFDRRLSGLMEDTTKYLVEESGAKIGYTQSDEISLVIHSETPGSQVFFNGRVFKITSQLAAMATAFFNKNLDAYIPEKAKLMPTFDCRAWTVPTKTEAVNTLLWRELDATKNSISMAASHYYSHKELMGKNGSEKQEMLFQKGVNWNDYPSFFKRGTYVQRKTATQAFTPAELERLPPMHNARKDPTVTYTRSDVLILAGMPPMSKIKNPVEVVFEGKTPVLGAQ